jgi:hypothetical protein
MTRIKDGETFRGLFQVLTKPTFGIKSHIHNN